MTSKWKRKQQTNGNREIWFIELIQTRVVFGWLSERSGWNNSCPRTFLTSYYNTIGQLNNAFFHIRFSWAGKRKVHVLIKQITSPYRNHFSRSNEIALLRSIVVSKALLTIKVEAGTRRSDVKQGRVCTGHWKPGKSWHLRIYFPGLKSQRISLSVLGSRGKLRLCFDTLVTADVGKSRDNVR